MRDSIAVGLDSVAQRPDAPAPTADIVIVNWNSGDWLRQCIASIVAYGGQSIGRIMVVDNGSIDGSDSVDCSGLPLDLIRTGANLGFGRACNLGAPRGSAPYLLFLNPDAALMPETLQTALTFLQRPENSKIGVCGVKLMEADGDVQRHCARFPTPITFLSAASGLATLFPSFAPALHDREFDHLSSRPVDHVIGAFYLIRRELFEKLGGFDERFFVYLEDLDLSARVRQAGCGIFYLSEAAAFHRGGGTSERVKPQRLAYALESRILYAFKHFRRPAAVAVTVMTLIGEPLPRILRGVVRGSWAEIRDTVRGFGLLWRRLAGRAVSRRGGRNAHTQCP